MTPAPLTHNDDRTGDTYVIYLTDDLQIDSIFRYIDRIGTDPLVYSAINEVPEQHQAALRDLWHKRKR